MIGFRTLLLAILLSGVSFSRPADAQYARSSSSNLTHVLSVTVPPRVKVRASPQNGAAGAIDLSVRATQAWVLSIRSAASTSSPNRSPLRWASSATGEFRAVTSADTVLVAGGRSESRSDTAVFFRNAPRASGSSADSEVFLTVTAP